MSTADHINKIIDTTFKVIQEVFEKQKECGGVCNKSPKSRIIFPRKRTEDVRVSEQELRFVFVEQLNEEVKKGWDVYYSVETPTIDTYRFKDVEPRIDPKGQSASFDLVIHDKGYHRIALIEFKAKNADEHEHKKDFVKLDNPKEGEGIERFFIEIVKGTDSGTINNLGLKTAGYKGCFRCWSLDWAREITQDIISHENQTSL
jgi:hypothetical protein